METPTMTKLVEKMVEYVEKLNELAEAADNLETDNKAGEDSWAFHLENVSKNKLF